jgi:hypothetical protein
MRGGATLLSITPLRVASPFVLCIALLLSVLGRRLLQVTHQRGQITQRGDAEQRASGAFRRSILGRC